MTQLIVSGLLIFSVFTEPWNSGKPVKSCKIHKNMRNTTKFARNLIKYMSIQHIWNVSRVLGLFNCRKLANLSWNFVTAMSNQRLKTTRRDYVAKNWALVMMLKDARQSAQIRSISSKICPENSPEISLIFTDCFSAKFAPKIPVKFPRNRPIFPRICLWKSRKIWLFSSTYQKPWF